MKNKYTLIVLIVFLISSTGFAKISLRLGPSAAMFNSGDEILKKIYGGNNFIYGFKTGSEFWGGFSLWFSGYFYNVKSRVSYTKEDTTFSSTSLALNLQYMPAMKWAVRPYIAVGYINTSYDETVEAENFEVVSGNGSGYSLMFGLDFKLNSRISFCLEAKYDSVIVKPTGFNVELGGFSAVSSILIKVL